VVYISQYSVEQAQRAGPIYGPVLKKPILMADLLDEVKRQLA
jgi:hypothetical protein